MTKTITATIVVLPLLDNTMSSPLIKTAQGMYSVALDSHNNGITPQGVYVITEDYTGIITPWFLKTEILSTPSTKISSTIDYDDEEIIVPTSVLLNPVGEERITPIILTTDSTITTWNSNNSHELPVIGLSDLHSIATKLNAGITNIPVSITIILVPYNPSTLKRWNKEDVAPLHLCKSIYTPISNVNNVVIITGL